MAVFVTGGGVVPSVGDENTVLLLHGDSFADSSIYHRAVQQNEVQLSSAQSKFGGTSFYMNNRACILVEPYNFSNANFTIDWWEYVSSASSGSKFCSAYTLTQNDLGGILFGFTGTAVYASSAVTGLNWDLIGGATMFDNNLNQWIHWAAVRNGNTLNVYKNGTLYASTAISGSIGYSSSINMAVGGYRVGDTQPFFTGYMQEFRISNVARWTSDFTPPTDPYRG